MVRFAAALLRQVSLFTREWIEIPTVLLQIYPCCCVSLFTREWIEMYGRLCCKYSRQSLPLYEGVDWNVDKYAHLCYNLSLPLYEGVDWNLNAPSISFFVPCLPLYEGVDWNNSFSILLLSALKVSLFTREWIEIHYASRFLSPIIGLPLYEGVDWNNVW